MATCCLAQPILEGLLLSIPTLVRLKTEDKKHRHGPSHPENRQKVASYVLCFIDTGAYSISTVPSIHSGAEALGLALA